MGSRVGRRVGGEVGREEGGGGVKAVLVFIQGTRGQYVMR